jgi:hypothetical protein
MGIPHNPDFNDRRDVVMTCHEIPVATFRDMRCG